MLLWISKNIYKFDPQISRNIQQKFNVMCYCCCNIYFLVIMYFSFSLIQLRMLFSWFSKTKQVGGTEFLKVNHFQGDELGKPGIPLPFLAVLFWILVTYGGGRLYWKFKILRNIWQKLKLKKNMVIPMPTVMFWNWVVICEDWH